MEMSKNSKKLPHPQRNLLPDMSSEGTSKMEANSGLGLVVLPNKLFTCFGIVFCRVFHTHIDYKPY